MAATAANAAVISVSSDDISYSTFVGGDNFSYNDSAGLLDVSSFDVAAIHKYILGLSDGTATISGFWESSTGQNLVRSSKTSGASIYIKCLFDGTNGYKVECKVAQYTVSGSVAGRVEFSASFQFNGTPTAVP